MSLIFKKLKYKLENYIYQKKLGYKIDINDFLIKKNEFSKSKLNIIYLTYFDSSFSINNTLMPLQEIGDVYKFELDPKLDRKNWYNIKTQRNEEMLHFVKSIIKKTKIDVIVCYLSGHSTTPTILKRIRETGILMVNESLDDERKFISRKGKDGVNRGNKDICKYFDVSLTTSKSAIKKYLVEGCNVLYKQYGANEKIYKNLNLPKIYDVAFVGSDYGVRKKYIDYLVQNGINLYTKGAGWKNGFARNEEMIEIFNKAKIVLGFSTVGKNDDIYILKGRDFEVPLTGSFYITGYHDELKEYFIIEKDIETYQDNYELLKKIKFYLKNKEKREEIARNGYKKCLENYTARESYERLFGYLGL